MIEIVDKLIANGCLNPEKITLNDEGQIEDLIIKCEHSIECITDIYNLLTNAKQKEIGDFLKKYIYDIIYFRIKKGKLYSLHLKDSIEKMPFNINLIHCLKYLTYIKALGVRDFVNVGKILFFNKYINYRFNKGEWKSQGKEVIGFDGKKVIYSIEGITEINSKKTFQTGIDSNGLSYFWDEEDQQWIEDVNISNMPIEDIKNNTIIRVDEEISQFINILKIDFVKEIEQQFEIHASKIITELLRLVENGELVKDKYCDIQLGPLLLKNFRVLEAVNIEIVLIRMKPAYLKVYIDLTGKGNMYFIQKILLDNKKSIFIKRPYWIPIYKLDSLKNIRDTEEMLHQKDDALVLELRQLIEQMILTKGSYVNVEFPYGRIEKNLCVEEIQDDKILLCNTKKRLIQSISINLKKRNVFVVYDSRKSGRNNGFGGSFSYLIKGISIVSS